MSAKNVKKVLVALSGGVDSSVAAALLVREGYEVAGAFMKNWSDEADPCTGECAWKAERQDALRVAATLGIPFETFDFEAEYRASVVDYMVREYAAGRTPNPDVMCNKSVKFDLFLKKAKTLGFDLIATGHYARVSTADDGTFRLHAGADPNKDQSYFLHQLSQDQLAATLFPVGHLKKSEVRALAKEFGLPTAEKKDSQGICFIGQIDLRRFLEGRIPARPGPIVTADGHVVGRHRGAAPFTIGQRHGLRIGGGAPYFVVEKDIPRNAVVVAREGESSPLYASVLAAGDFQWIAGRPPALPLRCEARIRYRQPLQTVCIAADGPSPEALAKGDLLARFDLAQRAVTPGQFVVLYDGDVCLGGGVIRSALAA